MSAVADAHVGIAGQAGLRLARSVAGERPIHGLASQRGCGRAASRLVSIGGLR